MLEDFTDTESVIILRLHHSFCDGMGIWGLVSLMNNKATHYSIPKMMKPRRLVQALVWLAFPFFVAAFLI